MSMSAINTTAFIPASTSNEIIDNLYLSQASAKQNEDAFEIVAQLQIHGQQFTNSPP